MNTIEGLQQYSAAIAKWQRDHFLYSYSRRPTKPVLRENEPPEEYARRVNAYSNTIKRWDGAPNPDDYGIVLYQKVLIDINQVLKFGTQHVRLFGYRLTTELEEFEHRRCSADTGCCEMCGRKFYPRELEMHHIIPVSERPDLVTSPRNLQMLCHGCHTKVHQQPPGTKLG